MLKAHPSFFRVLVTHDLIFFIVLFIGVISLFAVNNLFERENGFNFWLALSWCLFLTIIVIIKNLRRYRDARFFFKKGHKRTGKIIHKAHSYLTYEYTHHGRTYRAGENLPFYILNKFKIGQDVNILIDNSSPSHSLFYDLYS